MKLPTFVKANFLAGLFGSIVFAPLAYVYDLVTMGHQSQALKFGPLDLAMLVLIPFLTAVTFAAAALMAFPVVSYLERKGLLSLAELENGRLEV